MTSDKKHPTYNLIYGGEYCAFVKLEAYEDRQAKLAECEAGNGKLKNEIQHMQMTDSHMAQYNIKATAKIEELETKLSIREKQLALAKDALFFYSKKDLFGVGTGARSANSSGNGFGKRARLALAEIEKMEAT